MIILNNVNIPLDTDFSNLIHIAAKELKTEKENILSVKLHKKSVDARRKSDVHFCCSFIVEVSKNEDKIIKICKKADKYNYVPYVWQKAEKIPETPPVIVGFGPAGMFAGLTLARAGLKPVIVERGQDVDKRTADVNAFFEGGELDENSNVQFGEGGAGTFSDGKLNTGIKDKRIRAVLETFAEFGANEDILTDAKPHIGTDILKTVVKNIRKEIVRLGGEVRFGSKLEDFCFEDGELRGITVNGEKIKCNRLILAIGHSARDTFLLLKNNNFLMERKPFAVGVRIEHLQTDINRALYGDFCQNPNLSAADYKLAVHLKNGRGVYTFCMCPGGEVINASSEKGHIAVNGMSYNARNGENSNSALLVGVNPEDFEDDDVLAGCEFQKKIEKRAYSAGQGAVPVQTVGNFVFGEDKKIGRVKPTVKPDFKFADFEDIFPDFVTDSLKEGILAFDKKINGFADKEAILTAPETRSSSPIRILRDEFGESLNKRGIYPCGEGAGYAGGITSAAVDGIKSAEFILDCLK